jgi:hypothetical protein
MGETEGPLIRDTPVEIELNNLTKFLFYIENCLFLFVFKNTRKRLIKSPKYYLIFKLIFKL